uniref:Si:ch73-379j16.2 n=1 Tax=Cynoglossus semilaevis TaxID=244447 RepID=A0A3P8V3E1_CYNSE
MNCRGLLPFCLLICFTELSFGQVKYTTPEEVKVGSVIGNVAKDLGLDVSTLISRRFRIVSGAQDALFEVNPNNGVLSVHKNLDRERLCDKITCLLDVKIVVENPLEIHYITVEITDANDHVPTFVEKEKVIEIAESTLPGARFQLPVAHDPDVGINSIQRYRISNNDNFNLEIRDRGEDKIPFLVLSLPDGTSDVYKLDIQASDKGQPPFTTDCRVLIKIQDVNDNKPEIDVTSISNMIPEDSKQGTVVSLISVTDKDSNLNGKVICKVSGDVPFELKPSFKENMYSLVTKAALDRETVSHYDLSITATDCGEPPLSTIITLSIDVSDVNDNAPEFPHSPLELYLLENNVPGAPIFSVSAFDKDLNSNAAVSYQIRGEDGGHKDLASFLNINSDNGGIVALKSFDFEKLKKFNFHVVASDSGSPSLSSNVTVNVFILDQNDNPPVILYPLSSNGSAEAYDPDIGYNGWLLFSLQEVSDHSLFNLDRYTGQIKTLRPFTETDEAEHKLVILVKDNGNVSLSYFEVSNKTFVTQVFTSFIHWVSLYNSETKTIFIPPLRAIVCPLCEERSHFFGTRAVDIKSVFFKYGIRTDIRVFDCCYFLETYILYRDGTGWKAEELLRVPVVFSATAAFRKICFCANTILYSRGGQGWNSCWKCCEGSWFGHHFVD